MNIIKALSNQSRTNLRYNMHKVAAVMSAQEGFPLMRDEVTIKEAAYLIGARYFKHYLEKRAMLDGIMHVMKLAQ